VLATLTLGVLLQQPARIQPWNPDPSALIVLPKVEVDWEQARRLGISALVRLDDGHASNVTLTFFPREGKTFGQHVLDSHRLLIVALPDKTVLRMDDARLREVFARAGVASKSFAYPNGKPVAGASRSLCDAVAVHLETPAGFWTVSLNGDAGETSALWAALERFMLEVKVVRLDSPARLDP
jgi:hypothetical protein